MNDGESVNRREFLRSLGRGAVLGALALGGAGLLAGSRGLCVYDLACEHCPVRTECRLTDRPGAATARTEPVRQSSEARGTRVRWR